MTTNTETREVDFDDAFNEPGKLEKWKGETGKKYRLALIYDTFPMPDRKDPQYATIQTKIESGQMESFEVDGETFVRKMKIYNNNVHKFVKGPGYVIETPGSAAILGDVAKPRFAALIIEYRVDPQTGLFYKDPNGKPILDYALKSWTFSYQTFKKLKNIGDEYPLISVDLRVDCEDGDFQKLNFAPGKEASWRKSKSIEAKILAEAKSHWRNVSRTLGRTYTDDELRDKLGLPPVGGPVKNAVGTEEEFDSIAASLE